MAFQKQGKRPFQEGVVWTLICRALSNMEAISELSPLFWWCGGWQKPHWVGCETVETLGLDGSYLASPGSMFETQNFRSPAGKPTELKSVFWQVHWVIHGPTNLREAVLWWMFECLQTGNKAKGKFRLVSEAGWGAWLGERVPDTTPHTDNISECCVFPSSSLSTGDF